MSETGFNLGSLFGYGGRVLRTSGSTSHAPAGSSASARLSAIMRYATGSWSSYQQPSALSPEEPKAAYRRRASHPQKLFPGFKRNVQAEDTTAVDLDGIVDLTGDSPPKQSRPSGAVCASCGSPLRLGMPAEGRPWALKCGHLVDAACVAAARVRRANQPGRWRIPRFRKPADDDEWLPEEETKKPKAVDTSQGDDGRTWIGCPVDGCDGAQTDLLAFEGPSAPWECFL